MDWNSCMFHQPVVCDNAIMPYIYTEPISSTYIIGGTRRFGPAIGWNGIRFSGRSVFDTWNTLWTSSHITAVSPNGLGRWRYLRIDGVLAKTATRIGTVEKCGRDTSPNGANDENSRGFHNRYIFHWYRGVFGGINHGTVLYLLHLE